jgi:hypothetical protein
MYTWQDKGVKRVSTWSKPVRRAMLKGGAEFQRQKMLNRAACNWNKEFLRTTDKGVARIRQVVCTGVKCDLMDSKRWVWECMLQLQEAEDRKTPAATTWGAEFYSGPRKSIPAFWVGKCAAGGMSEDHDRCLLTLVLVYFAHRMGSV